MIVEATSDYLVRQEEVGELARSIGPMAFFLLGL